MTDQQEPNKKLKNSIKPRTRIRPCRNFNVFANNKIRSNDFSYAEGDESEIESLFTVMVLCYGNYPHLSNRVLSSLVLRSVGAYDLRIGLNCVCKETIDIVQNIIKIREKQGQITRVYDDDSTTFKYPRMRIMLRNPVVETPYVMWFDDDSCIAPDAKPGWFIRVAESMKTADMVGKLYTRPWQGNQPKKIMQAPWYRGKPVSLGQKLIFITGGWWTIKTKILLENDWPPIDLIHNGGDTMLCEVLRQQDYKIRNFEEGVWINADKFGNASKSWRRGASHKPYGFD